MRFSIITITKDNPDGLARTSASVEMQTFRDYEWVVIDGAVEADAGIYDAMNKGLDRSTGDYVIFMNAGDVFASDDVLEKIAPCLGNGFLYGDAIEADRIKRAHHNIAYGMVTHHQAMIYRHNDLRYDTNYKIAADYKFTVQAMRNATVRYLPFPICIFEQGGISQQKTALGRQEQAQIRHELGVQTPLVPMAQAAAMILKQYAPRIYWMLRSRFRTSRA